MLNKFKSASLTAALICISFAAVGCGGKSDPSNGTGAIGVAGIPGSNYGIVTPVPGGGGQVMFSGTNVYSSLGYQGQTAGFSPTGQSTLTLGALSIPPGQTSTYTGQSMTGIGYGSTISLVAAPVYPGNPLSSNIAGTLTFSASFMQALQASGHGTQVLGLYLDLWTNNASIYGGQAYVCTYQDQGGCHGSIIQFTP